MVTYDLLKSDSRLPKKTNESIGYFWKAIVQL